MNSDCENLSLNEPADSSIYHISLNDRELPYGNPTPLLNQTSHSQYSTYSNKGRPHTVSEQSDDSLVRLPELIFARNEAEGTIPSLMEPCGGSSRSSRSRERQPLLENRGHSEADELNVWQG